MSRIDLENPDARFSIHAVILFGCGGAVISILDLTDDLSLFHQTVQYVLTVFVWAFMFAALFMMGRRRDVSRSLRFALTTLLSLAALHTFIIWSEDVAALANVPILGRNSSLRVIVKYAIVTSWFMTPPSLALALLGHHKRLIDSLEQRVDDRTQELTEANQRLEREVGDRIATTRRLEEARSRLESIADMRSHQLRAAQQQLVQHERLRALGQMASGLAHELNNTLMPVTSYAALLSECDNLSDEQRTWLTHISQASADAAHVVRNLQTFHGKGNSTNWALVDPAAIVQQVIDLTRPIWKDAAESDGKSIQIQSSFNSQSSVRADAAELRQVITNFVLNAVDAIDKQGTIQLTLDESEGVVRFQVGDTGRGMTSEERSSCTEPFFSTKTWEGTGLGLSVCDGIVRKHGSQLMIESEVGVGTSLSFSLPAHPMPDRSPHSSDDSRKNHQVRPALSALYVDDDDDVRRSFELLLRSLGLDVECAKSGSESLEMLANTSYDLLFIDLGMPEMDGAEVIQAAQRLGCDLTTIVVSGWPTARVLQRFENQIPPDHVLGKPVMLDDLRTLLAEIQQSAGPVSDTIPVVERHHRRTA